MQQGDVVFRLLTPTDENAAKAIHPTVGSLHYPASQFGACPTFDCLGLLTTRTNVPCESELLKNVSHLIIVITFVHTDALPALRRGLRSFDGYAGECVAHHFHVVAVGAVDRQADGNAVCFDQQAAFDALLGAIGRVFACLFPPREVPWSCTHPCSARTSRCPSIHRRPSSHIPTSFEKLPLAPILENGHGPWSRDRSVWHPAPSIDTRFAARREWPPCRPGQASVACRRRSDGYLRAWGATLRWAPTNVRECTTDQLHATRPCHDLRGLQLLQTNVSCSRKL